MKKTIQDILYQVAILQINGDVKHTITTLAFDSRQVIANTLFIAVRGTQVDGHDYISIAIDKGATAIVCEEYPATLLPHITYVKVVDSAEALSYIACNFYDNPSAKLQLIGVTGTNGKTTTATLLYNLFSSLGYPTGLLSTVENKILHTTIPSTHTTPDPIQLHSLLAKMVELGCSHCFMEVSSHAVVQHRITGLTFKGGIFTNLTHDHLDYHGTFAAYRDAKKLFFDKLPKTAFAIVNEDDRNGKFMLQNTKAKTYTYAQHVLGDFRVKIMENSFHGLVLNINGVEVTTSLIGSFNAYNVAAIYGTASLLGIPQQELLIAISKLQSVSGRFQYLTHPITKVTVIIDYAHTPDALENVLTTIADIKYTASKVITVVGCGGDRDKQKRPIMAKIAEQYSDYVFLTSDNPRTENPETILHDMLKGVQNPSKVTSIVDRSQAIHEAIQQAAKNDVVLIAGKGHETYQEIHGVKYPFDDTIIAKQFLEKQ